MPYHPGARTSSSACLLLLVLLSFLPVCEPVCAADCEKSEWKIIIPKHGSQDLLRSALLLSENLTKVFGSRVGVSAVVPAAGTVPIYLFTDHERIPGIDLPGTDTLGPDGFMIRTGPEGYVIAALTSRGLRNGCYSFLEELEGFRMYAPGVYHVPGSLAGEPEHRTLAEKPFFTFRELYGPAALDTVYRDWHKLHRQGENYPSWGMWVHTFSKLVPPAAYFDSHPEFFSLVGGVRVPDGQLCLSNPEVLQVLVRNLRDAWSLQPETPNWSVSQNDTYKNCECDACRHLDSLYGGPSGTMIWFVNQVAREFPDKTISTLAYQYTRHAPEHVKPMPNVQVVLCTIECDRSRPVSAGDPGFEKDLADWSRLTDNLMIWDYIVQFRNYLDPFPNLRVLQPNLQLFRSYNARLMFQQGSGSAWCDMSELRQYLVAHYLWDPDADGDRLTRDFLDGYFGPAGIFIAQYLKLMHDSLAASGGTLGIYGFPFDGYRSYLTPGLMGIYETYWDQAQKAAAPDPELTARVLKARLPLLFARLDISLHEPDSSMTWFEVRQGRRMVKQPMADGLDTMVARCGRYGIRVIDENGTTPEKYRVSVREWLNRSLQPDLATGKTVILQEPASPKYPVGGASALTNGIFGFNDYHYNWLGFEGTDMDAMVDLGEILALHQISAGFLQYTQAWIFLPAEVTFSVSPDGITWSDPVRVPAGFSASKSGSIRFDYTSGMNEVSCRFIRVHAASLKTCPLWHAGHGQPCWIFCDEIVVH